MRPLRLFTLALLLVPVLFSCDKTLKVNADWKDITVVYGLLDQSADTTFIKVTKAFLGEGNAYQFAAIPDSSNYPNKLDVMLYAYQGSVLKDSVLCDTVMIHNKKAGDSIFYYPDQLMYYTTQKLDTQYVYNLSVKNKETGKLVTSKTELVRDFTVNQPQEGTTAGFQTNKLTNVKWFPAKNGKRYQLVIRFTYIEFLVSSPSQSDTLSFDWLIFSNIKPVSSTSTSEIIVSINGGDFYTQVAGNIKENPLVTRAAYKFEYFFTVAAPELNTYMEVTEPSLSLVQEKPTYTNISNGLGLFSARYTKVVGSLSVNPLTKNELKENPLTANLGF